MHADLKLGEIIEGHPERDAIHVAVAPVRAAEKLAPGQRVGLMPDGSVACPVTHNLEAVGVIDPFLVQNVHKGQRCWLFLFPNTVTGLRHDWSHPSFRSRDDKKYEDAIAKIDGLGSRAKIEKVAATMGMSYDQLMQAAQAYVEHDRLTNLGSDIPDVNWQEFWQLYGKATGGDPIGHDPDLGCPFRCAC